jgi:hypothetical protein
MSRLAPAVFAVLSFFIAHSAHAEFRAMDFLLVFFQQGAWNKSDPDAAGCITYTASRDNADIQLGNPSRLFRAPNNATAIFCNGALHLAQNITAVEQFQAVMPGFAVVNFSSIAFQGDRWTRAGPNNVFLMTYSTNAANAQVQLTVASVRFRVRAPMNGGTVQTVDRFAHFSAGFELVRERPVTCADGECPSCDYDPPLPSEFLAAAMFQFLETGKCYQPGAEN